MITPQTMLGILHESRKRVHTAKQGIEAHHHRISTEHRLAEEAGQVKMQATSTQVPTRGKQ